MVVVSTASHDEHSPQFWRAPGRLLRKHGLLEPEVSRLAAQGVQAVFAKGAWLLVRSCPPQKVQDVTEEVAVPIEKDAALGIMLQKVFVATRKHCLQT
jgi:hypothetical protein